jgi:hypothetical protein
MVVWSDFHCVAPDAIEPTIFHFTFTWPSRWCHMHPHHRSFASFEAKLENRMSTCFMMKQAVGCRCMSSHRLYLIIDFEAQTDKPPPTWFWGPNQETVIMILRPKSPNHRPWFWGPNQETIAVVLIPNYWQTIATSFEAKPENPRFSSPPRVRCESCTTSPNLLIVRPPSIRLVRDHP